MNDLPRPWYATFIQQNGWAIAIVAASIIAQWSIFSYRLNVDEQRLDKQSAKIQALSDNYNAVAVSLAGIQKDIEYIRLKVDRLAP